MTAGLLSADWAAAGGGDWAALAGPGDFRVAYAGLDGVEVSGGLDVLGKAGLERCRPVRSFPSYKGQRNYPGWYWSATMGRRVGFESWVERDHLVALDFDPAVTSMASQPFWLSWRTPAGKVRRHAPDFFARLGDGGALVVDSRLVGHADDGDREAFAATRRACELLGWGYAVCGAMDPVVAANHRWLAGYRHPRCWEPGIAGRLRAVFASGRALMDGATSAGDPLATLPVLFHMMWRRELAADLSLVLSDRTIVRGAGRG